MSAKEEIERMFDALRQEIEQLDAQAEPLIRRSKELQAQMRPLQDELMALSDQVLAIRNEDYFAKKRLYGQLAVGLGGKVLRAESG